MCTKTKSLLPFSAAATALASLMVVTAACDPDLNIVTKGGDEGGTEGGAGPIKPSPGGDATAPTDLDAGDGGGTPQEDTGAPPSGHKIDGVNDFAPGEKFVTTSTVGGAYEAFVSWDAQRIYFGMSGADVGSKASNKWVLVYLGVSGTPGTKTGIQYGGQQQPTLTFDATHHVRWKASGDYSSVEIFEGGVWKASNVALIPLPIIAQQGTFMEMSLARASIGATAKISVHINMLIEGGGNDWTYAGAPSTSFVDGKNPSFTKYFDFDLADTTKAPNTYVPQ